MPFDDTNRGALFREQKEKETDRDYSGTINIGGVEYWLSGWVKTSKKGAKYLSISVKPKDARVPDKSKPLADELDDSISRGPCGRRACYCLLRASARLRMMSMAHRHPGDLQPGRRQRHRQGREVAHGLQRKPRRRRHRGYPRS
jgi:hypothetical protein